MQNEQKTQEKILDMFDKCLKAVAKKLHINVKYVTDADGNGSFDPATATLTIVQGAKRGDATTLAHEIGEYARAYNYEAYKNYVDTIINYLFEIDAVSTEQDIMAYHRTYHADVDTTTIQDAKEELVNDVTARLFFAEGGIEQIVQHISENEKISVEEKKNFFETLKEIINKIVDVIKNHVTNNHLSSSEKAISNMSLDDIKKLRTQFLDVIDGAIANLENGVEVGTSTKNSTDVKKHIVKKKKTTYNEFNTLAMRWAYSNNTNIGDSNILCRNGKEFVLIEATEDGYIELASGNYESVRYEYERIHEQENDSIYEHIEKIRSQQRPNMWNIKYDGGRTDGSGNSEYIGGEEFQNNTTGNNEHLRSGNKDTSKQLKKSLDVDSEGNTLSKQQQEYFKDSKVRDENGRLKVMYHGTPNATYNAFRVGTYFTENEEYADTYQYPGASSISVKSTAENPDTYAVYLDIKKPFDTRNQKERDIFNKEFYLKWGNGSPLQESGLPDWVEGMDLLEFLEEKGYDYDGLILDEGGTGGYGEDVNWRGLSYVIASPNQAKRIDNKTPTKNPDMRFSLDVPVEETKDLIAVHNTSEDKLMKSLQLGGLPMPSIAVMKAKEAKGNSVYGNISLVFPKSTIDPSLNTDNKIYGGDAWTPVYPTVEYKINEDKANEIYSRARKATKNAYAYKLNSVLFHPSNIEDTLNKHKGESGPIDSFKNDYGMKQFYLAETGEPVKDVKVKETRTELSDEQVKMYDYLLEHFGDTLSILDNDLYPARKWAQEHGDEFDNVRREYYRQTMPDITEEQLDNIFNNLNEKPIDYGAVLRENEELAQMNEDLKRMLELSSSQNEKLNKKCRLINCLSVGILF